MITVPLTLPSSLPDQMVLIDRLIKEPQMFKFDNPLATALTLVDDLPTRVIDTMKAGNLKTTAELYSDLTFLKACIEQLSKEKK